MVKGFGRKPHDVGLSPPMLGVTRSAIGILAGILPTVEPLTCLDVGRDLLVTIQAEARLRVAVESTVTALAVLL